MIWPFRRAPRDLASLELQRQAAIAPLVRALREKERQANEAFIAAGGKVGPMTPEEFVAPDHRTLDRARWQASKREREALMVVQRRFAGKAAKLERRLTKPQ